MEEWTRIGDWDFAPYGNRTISFARSDTGARYEITTREGDPDRRDADQPYPVVTMAKTEVGVLSFMVKTISVEGVYSLSGGLTDPDDLLGIEGSAWGELILTTPAVVNYWGDRVLLRQDTEVTG